MMDTKELQSAYDQWHSGVEAEEVPMTLYPWHRAVLRRLPELNGLSVLEVGCGRGAFALSLARQFPRADIVGVDFSSSAIEIATAQAQDAPNIRFQVEDAQALTFPDASFDVVLSCECLEHVPSPARMAGEIRRVLKPGGKFILTTENYFNAMLLSWALAFLRKQKFNSGSGVQPHENFFLFWRVKKVLQRAGLAVEHMESNHFQWLLLPRCAPERLCTDDFHSKFLKRLFRPFGRHFLFEGTRR